MIKQQNKKEFDKAGELNFVIQVNRQRDGILDQCNFAGVNCVKISGRRSTHILKVKVHIKEQIIINLKVSSFKCTLKVNWQIYANTVLFPFAVCLYMYILYIQSLAVLFFILSCFYCMPL